VRGGGGQRATSLALTTGQCGGSGGAASRNSPQPEGPAAAAQPMYPRPSRPGSPRPALATSPPAAEARWEIPSPGAAAAARGAASRARKGASGSVAASTQSCAHRRSSQLKCSRRTIPRALASPINADRPRLVRSGQGPVQSRAALTRRRAADARGRRGIGARSFPRRPRFTMTILLHRAPPRRIRKGRSRPTGGRRVAAVRTTFPSRDELAASTGTVHLITEF